MTEDAGLEDLVHVADALKAAGEQGKGLTRELRKELNRSTKPLRGQMADAIGDSLPRGGGLAADVQRNTRIATTLTTSSRSLGVRIRARSKRSIRRMNATGTVRHPVFGNREVFVTQRVAKGFLDEPFERARPDLRRAVQASIEHVRDQIYRSV